MYSSHIFIWRQNTDIMPPHKICNTGNEPTMKLTFESKGKYNKWKKDVDDLRSGIAFILATQYPEPRISHIYTGWIPQVECFEITWGIDFVPDDIKSSLVKARRLLDQSPPPNPVLLRLPWDELYAAVRCQNDKRKQRSQQGPN